ncbi:hypothetical protein J2W24_002935 [Variovorax boronicumulans]|nr:hypothetical protein [Variovorax boronicumulans]
MFRGNGLPAPGSELPLFFAHKVCEGVRRRPPAAFTGIHVSLRSVSIRFADDHGEVCREAKIDA